MQSVRNVLLGVWLGSLLAFPAAAQTGQQPPPKDPLSTWLRNAYNGGKKNITRAADKMPEEFYTLRPGAQTEVRTFGQIVGHLANFNYLWCSDAKGEKNPNQGNDFEKLAAKADLVKALNDALSYCDRLYSSLTDASGMEIIEVTNDAGRKVQVLRISRLIQNHVHNNEHYGNMVTYLRMKSIVPPSSEPAPPR